MSKSPQHKAEEAMVVGGFAHEMKGSISGASYALDVLMSRKDNSLSDACGDAERLREILLVIRDGLDASQNIISQALAYAALGRIAPANDHVDLTKLLSKLQSEFTESFATHNIACDVQVPTSLQLPMKEEHVYAIFRNLLANARDAIAAQDGSTAGKILVRAEDNSGQMTLLVEDNGPGIPDEIRGDIFKPFFTTKGSNGTGVGLGFCRQIVSLYGGEIDFESRVPNGTTFKVILKRDHT